MFIRSVRIVRAAFVGAMLAAGCFALSAQTHADSIRWAIIYQLNEWPESEYRDIYKNFMQDRFGPGHILKDKQTAEAYLQSELDETTVFEGPDYEPTGSHGNFYRVNIRVIKDGKIPFDSFFDAFVRSTRGVVKISDDQWRKEWSEIADEINYMELKFPNDAEDKREIEEKLRRGDFVMHHSQRFNESSNFHYRIISRPVFEKEILPKLTVQE